MVAGWYVTLDKLKTDGHGNGLCYIRAGNMLLLLLLPLLGACLVYDDGFPHHFVYEMVVLASA